MTWIIRGTFPAVWWVLGEAGDVVAQGAALTRPRARPRARRQIKELLEMVA